jgi:hypothetical protein
MQKIAMSQEQRFPGSLLFSVSPQRAKEQKIARECRHSRGRPQTRSEAMHHLNLD